MRASLRRRRGQAVVIFAVSIPFWTALLALLILGGFLLSLRTNLDSATESAALAAASQIDYGVYQTTGQVELNPAPTTDQPDSTACTSTSDQTLYAVCQLLQADYPSATIANANSMPTQINHLNFFVVLSNDNQTVEVTTYYVYPNPLGRIFVNDIQETSNQWAQPQLTYCNNGTNTC